MRASRAPIPRGFVLNGRWSREFGLLPFWRSLPVRVRRRIPHPNCVFRFSQEFRIGDQFGVVGIYARSLISNVCGAERKKRNTIKPADFGNMITASVLTDYAP